MCYSALRFCEILGIEGFRRVMGCFQQAVVGSLALNGVLLVVRWIYRGAVKTRGVHVLTQHCTSDPSIARVIPALHEVNLSGVPQLCPCA